LQDLQQCLETLEVPLFIFHDSKDGIPSSNSKTTFFVEESLDALQCESDWMKHVDSIRTDSRWLAQASWLSESPQAQLQ
jgi:hypothetical protein